MSVLSPCKSRKVALLNDTTTIATAIARGNVHIPNQFGLCDLYGYKRRHSSLVRWKMESTSNIIPRFDLELAKTLLKRGKCSSEVVAAAERLGDHQLKRSIERYIESTHESRSLGNILWRELGLGIVRYPFTTRGEARASCATRARVLDFIRFHLDEVAGY